MDFPQRKRKKDKAKRTKDLYGKYSNKATRMAEERMKKQSTAPVADPVPTGQPQPKQKPKGKGSKK